MLEQFDLEEERVIIEKARKNPEAFGLLYNRYYKPIFVFIHKRTNDKDATVDLSSQVFYKALTNLKSYTYQGFPFSSWLYRIAINEVNEYFRKKERRRVVSIDSEGLERLSNSFVEGNSDTETEERKTQLSFALKQLDIAEIQLIELRFFEEKSFKEIGYILSITENNAKVKTYRLIDKIRATMLLNYR